MAKKTTMTATIQVRRDTTANWLKNKDVIPAAGEPCLDLDTGLVRYGNGTDTYENLPVSGSVFSHYEAAASAGETDSAAIARAVGGAKLNTGDICVIKTALSGEKFSYKAFVYDGTNWAAMDGNYDAENVYFKSNLTYTAPIGVLTVPSSGSGTIDAEGKNVKDVLAAILAQEKNPAITQPTASVTLTGAGAKEVGSKFTPSYTASLSAGTYQFGPATGVTASTYAVTDTNSGSASTASGSFAEFTVSDDTNYKVTAVISYADGAVPKTNLGNSYAAGQIKADSKTAASAAVTGYRSWFMYIGNDLTVLSSDVVRAATSKGNAKSAANQSNVAIPAGTKRIFVALPTGTGYTKRLKSVIDIDGMGLDVFSNFNVTTVGIKGANGYTAMNYTVYCAENANGFAATHYNFIIG